MILNFTPLAYKAWWKQIVFATAPRTVAIDTSAEVPGECR